jgi:DNA-directed RNA polymerase specialized sigma24 family protein
MMEECELFEILDEMSAFETRILESGGLLRFIASRVLDAPEEIEEAVENCFRTASRNPKSFEYGGEFRSWLVRILLDEALVIRLRQNIQRGRRSRSKAERSPSS